MDMMELRVTDRRPAPVCTCQMGRSSVSNSSVTSQTSHASPVHSTVWDWLYSTVRRRLGVSPRIRLFGYSPPSRVESIIFAVVDGLVIVIRSLPSVVGLVGGAYALYSAYHDHIGACEVLVWRRASNV